MKLIEALKCPRLILFSVGMHGWIRCFGDKTYLKLMYWSRFGKLLDLKNPKTYNEKLQWLKLNYRKPEFTKMVDKCDAKMIVASIIGEKYINPTLGIWDSFDQIDFDKLPNQFVLKCTHDSGGLVICKNKEQLDKIAAKRKLEKCLKRNYYWVGREWPYKNVQPRIIAEAYMEDSQYKELRDYKIYVFNGKAKYLFILQGRGVGKTCADFYDVEFNHLDIRWWGYPNSKNRPTKPGNFDLMVAAAEKVANGHPHLRVDFYLANGNVYFGEITFYDGSGLEPFEPEYWDLTFGECIKLPELD